MLLQESQKGDGTTEVLLARLCWQDFSAPPNLAEVFLVPSLGSMKIPNPEFKPVSVYSQQ